MGTPATTSGLKAKALAAALLIAAIAVPAYFSTSSLAKGQVIKQFTAYSISESLSRDLSHWLGTSLPCMPPWPWVEEPPVFHLLAASAMRMGIESPAAVPMLAFVLMGLALWVLCRIGLQDAGRAEVRERMASAGVDPAVLTAATAAALFTPVFLRYSIQHIPDFLAAALMALGAVALFLRFRGRAAILFAVAVTIKVLAWFAVMPLIAWELGLRPAEFKDAQAHGPTSGKAARWALMGAIAVGLLVPFVAWCILINVNGVPSPFHWGNFVENRHSGSLALLIRPSYYVRWITWVGLQGVGLTLFISALWLARTWWREKPLTEFRGFIFCWLAGMIPYWLLVRQGNLTHDYYILPFLPPVAVMGVLGLLRLKPRWLVAAALAVSVAHGIIHLSGVRALPLPPGQARPLYCSSEMVR